MDQPNITVSKIFLNAKLLSVFPFIGISAEINVVYAVDGSESVSTKTFDEMKRFVKGALKSYMISPNKTHVGLTVYGGLNPIQALSVGDGTSKSTVERAIPFMGKIGGKRNLEKGLDSAANELIRNIKRKEVSKLIVLITTGKDESKDQEKLKAVGKKLKDNGIKVVVIVIGQDTGKDGLPILPFSTEGVMSVPSVDDLKKAVDFVEKAAAKATGNNLLIGNDTSFLLNMEADSHHLLPVKISLSNHQIT